MTQFDDETPSGPGGMNRREVLVSMSYGTALAALPWPVAAVAQGVAAPPGLNFLDSVPLRASVNGRGVEMIVDPRASLLDAVREGMGLFGTKKGCDRGQCGACTVHVDGRRVLACLMPAVQAEGREVTTIEGLAAGNALHPVQDAFIECDALQCGYCTPGQIMSAVACIEEGHAETPDQIREYMSGNLCRCGAYTSIVEAIELAKAEMEA